MDDSFAENQKRMQVLHKWCTVIIGMKFLLDFLVPENLDSVLSKLSELILPSVHFSRLRGGLI